MTKTRCYKVTLKLRNEIGVLARIAILLRKFQVNIHSVEASPIDNEKQFTNLNLILEIAKHNPELIMKKLERLIPVVEIHYDNINK